MRVYLVRRALQTVAVVFIVTTLTFVLVHLAPGDPLADINDLRVPPAVQAYWRHEYGLDRPLWDQYLRFLSSVARGHFGYSLAFNAPVSIVIGRALPNTIVLASAALLVSFAAGIIIAVIQVARRGSALDRVLGAVSLALYSVPDFWLAQVALLVFAYWIPIFPAGGVVDPVMHRYLAPSAAALDRLHHLVLPVLTLAALYTASVARFQRAALLDVSGNEYLRTARAKGVPERMVLVRHALRNATLPVITLFGLALPAFLTGTVFIERIFSWPGIGALAIDAVAARDYEVVVACAILGSVAVAVGSFLADALYALADPRLRITGTSAGSVPQ
jgi:peptide/nickel transport system permease protein